ncbi:hypothetical protein NEMIN01_2032 [Nematocida minor]|uniref:uncharacterized protein n=1 Tax=Nematocida minor TaxID=1912983 RepID=UPI00221EBBDC|nr:uncharacterized protein NEMIN01_2032 [Nematocida minor]KAI5192468.1 hypothetical protein NEMIN01_2032 [Nematocida minor]
MTRGEKIFVFDLNGTLLTRVKENKGEHLKVRDADEILPSRGDLIYIRPHLDALASYLHENKIKYVLWTTAMEHNGVHLVNAVKKRGLDKYLGTLFHSHSTPVVSHPFKRAKNMKVIADLYNTEIENVFLIDDEIIKCVPESAYIPISEYSPMNTKDDALLQIIETIKELAQ